MHKYKVFRFILLTAVLISSQAYGQQASSDKEIRTVSGNVLDVDPEGWVIDLQTGNGKMMFYIEAESGLYRFTHHMASVEIEKDDKLTIQYVYSSGKNSIIKLVDNTPSKI